MRNCSKKSHQQSTWKGGNQMTTELKEGQRIDVYKVLSDGGFWGNQFIPGQYRIGEGQGLISVLSSCQFHKFLFMFNNTEVKKVGTLIIKTIKNDTSL